MNEDQIQETNGGGLLGDDSSTLGGTLGGNIGISNTDEDGDTSSTNIDLGLGGILDSRNND
ncbi:MAG: hypothetical protein EOP51_03325 [Sphingobacteriales bacterium]|nr:MAG: hypothetical protein EOP51_03325 [Sphingobacteriales bacterium]